jgi:hypothetical protein
VAKETRKLRRSLEQKDSAEQGERDRLKQPLAKSPTLPDPLGKEQLKGMLFRIGLPVLAIWMLCGLIATVVVSQTAKIVLISIPALLTLGALGLVGFALRQAKKARGVAGILSNVETQEDRKAALSQLDAKYKKNDPAALFAKAQLELQDDPKKALATLEQIDLAKVMATVADEARGQRGMIHLMLGEVSDARRLVDGITLSRHQEPRTRAMLAAVCGEAWARSGAAKKATETLGLFDPEEAAFEPIRPQLYRALAFAAAHVGDAKAMKRALRRLSSQDPRLLAGFLMKRTHPLLQKEAKRLIEQSGIAPRRMMIDRG